MIGNVEDEEVELNDGVSYYDMCFINSWSNEFIDILHVRYS